MTQNISTDNPLLSAAFIKRMNQAAVALDQKTKPPGSLGEIESLAMQISAIQKTLKPDVSIARAILFAADHGVMQENISAYPQVVTQQMALNFTTGGAAANVLCNANQAELEVVNVGVIGEPINGVMNAKVADGTYNIATGSAMDTTQLDQAMNTGREAIQRAAASGAKLVALGEMGIGNTTSAAAMVSALCNVTANQSVGPGTGLDDEGIRHKVTVVEQILNLHNSREPQDVLQNMGGFEIAAIAGAMLEAPQHNIAVIVDGYIVTAAALCAVGMDSSVRENLIFSHHSAEPGHIAALKHLHAKPLLNLGLRLGEGSGAILAIPLIRSAAAILNDMATFDSAGVDQETASS